jgi:hypothetical protein
VNEWTNLYGTSSGDGGYGITMDAINNIYITGYTGGTLDGQAHAGGSDIFIIKFNASGHKLFTRLSGTSSEDVGRSIAVDISGNICITGHSAGALDGQTNAGGNDIVTMKFDASGNKLFTRLSGTTGNNIGWGIGVDTNGNMYVTGETEGSLDGQTNFGGDDIFLIKYDALGNKVFTIQYGTSGVDQGRSLAVDVSSKHLLRNFFQELSKDSGLYCYGAAQTMKVNTINSFVIS